jgi:transglutaminase-like putative cysteine protease
MALTFNATPITMKNATTPSLIHSMRQACGFMRTTASVVLIAFTLLTLQPLAAAARTKPTAAPARAPDGAEQRFAHTVEQIETRLRRLDDTLAKRRDSRSERQELNRLKRSLGQLDQEVRRDFERTERHIADRGLAGVIRQRHRDMVSRYRTEYQALADELDAVEASGDDNQRRRHAQTALDRLKAQPHKRRQQPFDPHQLPNSTLKADPDNKPKETEDAFTQAGLFDTPYPKLAALGDFTFDKLAGASNPAYLAESDEIVLTQAIKDKAAELQYDPVKIYHWVRNTIAWQPTWGGIQNAELTLSAKRGNAMDIASLTLALLRASKIPARYVHGTIDVPAAAFKNWAGGFTDINAAANFASSGGIPITSVVSGGQISKIRLEHIWVEAAIDFLPSRGAVNKEADSWVAMDPSYKQYDYLTGLDAVAISGIDPEQLAQSFIASGTVNDSEGWATGFDPTILKDAQAQVQQKLQDYIQNQMQNPTVGDVIGGRKTIVQEFPMLPSGLPNAIKVVGSRYDKLPDQLQQKITWAFSKDILGDLIDPVSFPFAKVNNQKITLSFRPATEADEQALKSLLPAGEITDLSQLPTTIPSYLIRVVPELAINGQVIKTGGALKLGEELSFITALTFAGRGQISSPRTYNVIAGSYLAVNAYAGSVSPAQLQTTKTQLEQTKTVLESADPTQIGALTREALLGDLFHAGGLGYYAQYLALSHLMGLQAKAHHTLAAGTGTFGYEPNVDYLFGFPRAIKSGGVVFDIPLVRINAVDDGNTDQLKLFALQTGLLSSVMEHAVPEQIFLTDPDNPPSAASAVKALQKAIQQGQRIYHITPSNNTTALSNIHHHPNTMAEIKNALNAGKEVITHTEAISVPGWTGAGYIILDPQTGDGSYKISGGANGGQSSEVGALDFMHAITGQPGLLFPKCSLPFIEQVVENFINTNKAIIGLTAPPGVTFITGGAVAVAAGGFTLVTAIKLSIKNPNFLLGNLATAILISMLNYVLVSLAYEIGVLMGSAINAAFCRREN